MPLSPYSLCQLDPAYLDALEEAPLRLLSVKRLEDWKEARDRLKQKPESSSQPPSSRALWARRSGGRVLGLVLSTSPHNKVGCDSK